MEGLLLAQAVSQLQKFQPFTRRGGWRFPAEDTFVLPLAGVRLEILSRPPQPLLELDTGEQRPAGSERRSLTSFQQLLAARAQGELLSIEQLGLDRVLRLQFAATDGFVSSPPVSLVVELTGRNSNVILLDQEGVILGAQREVAGDRNRYRQIQPGQKYRPPPPQDKTDPRKLGAEQLQELLESRTLQEARQELGGLGPRLTRVLAALAGVSPRQQLGPAELPAVTAAFRELLADPAATVERSLGAEAGLAVRLEQDERTALLARLEPVMTRSRNLFERQLSDLERLRSAAAGAAQLREQADLLLAFRPQPATGQHSVTLTDFAGQEITIALAKGQDAVGTAELFYSRARRREKRLEQALDRESELRDLLHDADTSLQELPQLPLARLRELTAELPSERAGQYRTPPGIRVRGPLGYTIIIGRNSRDNDQVTFGIARSRDVWLHVQGYRGSHVIIQANNREVPFETILHAARFAAGHSQAADSDNVPVDYTLRKDVWRVRGGAAGAVHFARQKTVYVTPLKAGGSAGQGSADTPGATG